MAVAAKRPQPPAGSRTSSPQTAAVAMPVPNGPHAEPLALPAGALGVPVMQPPNPLADASAAAALALGAAVPPLTLTGPAAPLPLFMIKPLTLAVGCPMLNATPAAALHPHAASPVPTANAPASPHALSSQTSSFAAAADPSNPTCGDGDETGSAPAPSAAAAMVPLPMAPTTPDLPNSPEAPAEAAAAAVTAGHEDADGRGWLYSLVTCPWLFKPCPTCCRSHTGRESLMTYFSPAHPTASRGLCGFCPTRPAAAAEPSGLLQIRRSTYHEVVKIADLGRLADVTGIQHYVINGAKVVFLRPRPQPRPPKGVAAPSRCEVDGRQLMDATARFCSLQCKLEGEDGAYTCRYALATAHAATAAAALSADLSAAAAAAGSGPGAAAAAAAAAVAADIAASGGEQPHHGSSAGGASGRGAPVVIGAKRAAGLLRFEGAEESGEEGEGATGDDAHPSSGAQRSATPPSYGGARGGKKPRAASAGVALAAAAARGAHLGDESHPHHHHHPPRRTPPPAQQHAAHAVPAAAAPGAPTAAVAASAHHAVSPTTSHDSGRSSTCRWHAKRRKGEPVRAPLQ